MTGAGAAGALAQLTSFHACCWSTLSNTREAVSGAQREARSWHPASSLVVSCQRTEAYSTGPCDCPAPVRFTGIEALRHLASVAAGLDSLVLGEQQILGQVRTALSGASPDLARLANVAISAARDLRREYTFQHHSGHLLDRGLTHAGLDSRGILVVLGTGVMSRLVAQRGREIGFSRVIVAGRTAERAASVGSTWIEDGPFEFIGLAEVAALEGVDVVAGCLGSDAPELDPATGCPPDATLILDLGTPCNFVRTPKVVALSDMAGERRHSDPARARLRDRLNAILDRRLGMAAATACTPVGSLRMEVERLRQLEVERIRKLHPELPGPAIDVITRSLVNRLFHRPSENLRRLGDDDLATKLVALFTAEDLATAEQDERSGHDRDRTPSLNR